MFQSLVPPQEGIPISLSGGRLSVPDQPVIPFIEGDGIGPDIWHAARRVFEGAVETAYHGKRRIVWFEVFAGEKAYHATGDYLPNDTVEALRRYVVGIKGPLTTPVGGGIRSINVRMRQELDLYVCMRPVRWFKGVKSPVCHPERVDVVVFRENTEDVYAGIEWADSSAEAAEVRQFLQERFGIAIRADAGIGLKPISREGTRRLVRKAIEYALEEGRRSVTLVHKGNIMKHTEGAFRAWGYELAREEFRDQVVTEQEAREQFGDEVPEGKVVLKDRIADAMFQNLLLHPEEYDVLATPNLNGDYLSDALAAQVGGLGMAPGGNLSDHVALFEATHGTAPTLAGKNVANPGSLILSGVMMLEYMGWHEAAGLILSGMERAIGKKRVTTDLAEELENAEVLSTTAFADEVLRGIEKSGKKKDGKGRGRSRDEEEDE